MAYEILSFGLNVHVHDPVADSDETRHEYAISLKSWEDLPKADALVLAVAHHDFVQRPLSDYAQKLQAGGCFIDVKSQFERQAIAALGYRVWRL